MISPGTTLTGKVSWFGGPHDPTSGPTTASGSPISAGGIAFYSHETLGGYWSITYPNGRTVIEKQTDYGPAPWTGRLFDVAYTSLAGAGYTESNFPTNGTVKATYLGKNPPAPAAGASSSTSSTPSSTTSSSGSPSFSNAPGGIFALLEKGVLYAALVIGAIVLIGFGTKAGLQPGAKR